MRFDGTIKKIVYQTIYEDECGMPMGEIYKYEAGSEDFWEKHGEFECTSCFIFQK